MAKVTFDKDGLAESEGHVTVYNFDSQTGEFSGENDEFLLKGLGLPANSTIISPPEVAKKEAAVFRDEQWQIVEDHRGETVWPTDTGKPVQITELGSYPEGTTTLEPGTEFDVWDGKKWVTDKASQSQAAIDTATAQKKTLIQEANSITQAWQTQLLLGIINDDDKATLTQWMRYVQAVNAVDTSSAPDIEWPEKPV